MKKLRLRYYIAVIGCFIILSITLKVFVTDKKQEVIQVVSVSNIEESHYVLESNDTKIFKKYFKNLEKELKDAKVDEENYAKLITKLFLIDFYTLSNKITNQDIGGVQFIETSFQDNFKQKAKDTIYKYVKSNIYGNRSQELPTVKDVEIESFDAISFSYQDKIDQSAYQISAKIIYKKDLGYDTSKTLILVHNQNKLEIVEIQ